MSEELHERVRELLKKDGNEKREVVVLLDEDDYTVIRKIACSSRIQSNTPRVMSGRISDIIAGMCHYVIDSKRKQIESESISAALLHDKLFQASSNLFDNSTRSASDLLEESRKIASEAILERDNQ